MEFTEEQILLRALSRGDEKAFEVLFMRYFPRVKRFISGLLQDDITVGTLHKIFSSNYGRSVRRWQKSKI